MLKVIRILAVSVLILASCSQSNDEKARELVEHYCETNLNYKDYRPVVFGQTKRWNGSIENHTLAVNSLLKLKRERDSIRLLSAQAKDAASYQGRIDSLNRLLGAVDTTGTKIRRSDQEVTGWQILHTYFYKNSKGAKVKVTTNFIINEKFNRVLQALDQ